MAPDLVAELDPDEFRLPMVKHHGTPATLVQLKTRDREFKSAPVVPQVPAIRYRLDGAHRSCSLPAVKGTARGTCTRATILT